MGLDRLESENGGTPPESEMPRPLVLELHGRCALGPPETKYLKVVLHHPLNTHLFMLFGIGLS